jgi:BatD DUF11 like domain
LKKIMPVLLLLVLALASPVFAPCSPAIAQGAQPWQLSLTAKASRSEVATGETFSYTLSVIEEGEADVPFRLVPPDFSGFNVTGEYSSQSTRIINNKARTVNEEEFRLSSDLPGDHLIPPAKAVVADPSSGKESEIKSNPVTVKVTEHGPGVLKGLQQDIRDIKGPMPFLERLKLFFYIAAALVVLGFLLVAALIVYMARRGRRDRRAAGGEVKGLEETAQAPAVTGPKDDALKALDAAEVLKADSKVFYSVISEAIRRYLRAAYGIPATEATTAEIMEAVKSSTLSDSAIDGLRKVLEEADLVKFAKYEPTEDEKTRYLEKARNLLLSL